MQHQIVSRDEWITARRQLLAEEKELTRLRDKLNARRRDLPWVKVEKTYVFDGPNGKETLADLFAGRSQLLVRHFMFGPGWGEGCVGCSFLADHLDGALVHLEHHDVTVVVVSRAPFPELEAFRQRMGWRFKWVSSFGSDFNYDYHVSFTPEQIASGKAYYNYRMTENAGQEMPGASVFYKDADGTILHTYSAFARGGEPILSTYSILDMMPLGRNETGPNRNLTDWVRLHDRYDDVDAASRCAAG
jgi:predicted dithiol-disulfide oxidoreductase (DUF899 family)